MAEIPTHTQVAIIGGGPAGSLLAYLLHREGIESVILEWRSRQHVLERVRAGVIEHASAQLLDEVGLGERMKAEGYRHRGVNLAFEGRLLRIDFQQLVGKEVVIYGQTELQKDLYHALDGAGIPLVDEAEVLEISGLEGATPSVTFRHQGATYTLDCDFVAGCDGAHGTTRHNLPPARVRSYERTYPFVWVGVLSATPPVNDELIYANHETGFALCSMRNDSLSRYYVQGAAGDQVDDWPDDRFWASLKQRLPHSVAEQLVTGDSIEKLVTPLRSWVAEPLSHGRLYLAGDAAHVVPPTGAKGLNLAISDVYYLTEAFSRYFRQGTMTDLWGYSDRALTRVWKAVRFSWWMTRMMHCFPGVADDFDRRLQQTELQYLHDSENARRAMAENYVGLPW